jgi:hypothetical protein
MRIKMVLDLGIGLGMGWLGVGTWLGWWAAGIVLRTWFFAFPFLSLYISENQYQTGLFVCMCLLVSSELWPAGSTQNVRQEDHPPQS